MNEDLVLLLTTAIANKKPITLRYQKSETEPAETRVVEPTDVRATEAGDLVLTGWCRTRKEERTFRVDRVTEAMLLRGGRPRFTKPHLAHLDTKLTEDILADLDAGALVPETSYEYECHAAFLAGRADQAEARGLEAEAQRLWELADLAWELADLG